jgi:hypothetical protein
MTRQGAPERFVRLLLAALLFAAFVAALGTRSPDPRGAIPTADFGEATLATLPPVEGVLASAAKVSRGEAYERNERTRPTWVPVSLPVACLLPATLMWRSAALARRRRTAFDPHPRIHGPRAPPLQLR